MSPCGSETFRTRVLSRANSPPAAWSSAARRAISRSTARHGHPTISHALQSGRLVTVLDDYTAPPLALRALYPHNRHLSAKVRAFVDFLASRFGQEPPWDSWCRAPGEQTALPARHRREMTGSPTKPRRSKTRADAP